MADTRSTKQRTARMAALMDRLMSGGRGRLTGVPKPLTEHRLTQDQVRDVASKVSLKSIPGKGLGLVARKDLPAHTMIGVYGGKVYTTGQHAELTRKGATTGKYSVDFYKHTVDGKVRDGYIMDPGAGAGNAMHPTHANVLAAFINEPTMAQTPNVVWVRNYDANSMELYTTVPVRRGQELTACYGSDYPRKYKTPCTAKASSGALHYIRKGMKKPLPV